MQQKLDFYARLQDVLQGTVKPSKPLLSLLSLFLQIDLSHAVVITQCCIQALYEQGEEGQAAVDMAKEFERRKCNHFKKRPEDECMIAMAGKHSPFSVLAVYELIRLREIR